MYNNLRIFNGTQYNLNAVNINGVFEASVYLDEVSTGLYESVNLFFLEEVKNNQDTFLNKPIAETINPTNFEFIWKDDIYSSNEIIMYVAKLEDNIVQIEEKKTQVIPILENNIVTGLTQDGVKIVSLLDNSAIQVNVAINSQVEGRHQRTLLVYSNDGVDRILIGSIFIYGEVVGEDERLKILLQNFGASLEDTDTILFKEHDISEMSPDYILLNQKRRELLLELSNIKPFIGTYKAILNMIDFFGYDSITLKEYWLNINTSSSSFGKLYAVPVPRSSKYGEATRKKIKVQVPSSGLKKTGRFSLVYKINTPNGGVDQWDIPTVSEVFDFTPEEVLIKLYGLKRKLQKEYLPLNARIIDIVGEADFFTQKNQNIWNNQNHIAFFSEGIDIDFGHFPSDRSLFIEDMSLALKQIYDPNNLIGPSNTQTDSDYTKYHTILNTPIDQYYTLPNNLLIDLKTAIELFYQNYYESELNTYNQDIVVGSPVILNGEKTFKTTWDHANFTWYDALDPNSNLLITWNNWWKRWVYEIEWIIKGPKNWTTSYRGPIDQYLQIPVVLPHDGTYDIEMRAYDLFGHRSYDYKRGAINVRLKEIELYAFYKKLGNNTWDDRKNIRWKQVGGYWDLPIHNLNPINLNIASWYLGLNRSNYIHDITDIKSYNFATVSRYLDISSNTGYSETSGPYFWDNCDFGWNWTSDIWWDATRIGSDVGASFLINDIQNGSVLTINHVDPVTNQLISGSVTIQSMTPTSLLDITGWQEVVNELNGVTQLGQSPVDPIIDKFVYNLVLQDLDNDGVDDTVLYILAVGRQDSRTYDYDSVQLTGGIIEGFVHHVSYNPNFDDTEIYNDWRCVNRSTHVTFCPEYSKMPGMKLKSWIIKNNTNPDKSDIYYDDMVLTYLFKYPGDYTIQLEVEDTNGNVNTIQKNMLKVN
jgi:hypothetical protein